MNKKIGWVIMIVVLGIGASLAIGVVRSTMQTDEAMTQALSGSTLSNEEIRQMCVNKLNELVGAEYVTPLSVNTCVGTVLDELNK